MRTYKYKALDIEGNVVEEKLTLEDERQLIDLIHKKELFLLKYKLTRKIDLFSRVSCKDIGMFCKQLSQVLRCGMSLLEGIDILCLQKINPEIISSLYLIKVDIENGESIFSSMNKYPKIYSKFMTEMVQIGEESGSLVKILDNLSTYYMDKYNVQKKVKTALIYPISVFVITLMIVLFLILKIIPDFMKNMGKVDGVNIEGIIKIMEFNDFITSGNLIGIVIAALVLVKLLQLKGYLQKILDFIKLKVPVINKLYEDMYENRIARNLNILISSGIPIISALEIIKKSLSNESMERKITRTISNIKEGMSLTKSLKKEKIFKDFFISMISVGEETGNLEEMIDNAVKVNEIDSNEFIDKFTRLIEPITILILGVIILGVIINVMMPMMNMMDSFGFTI